MGGRADHCGNEGCRSHRSGSLPGSVAESSTFAVLEKGAAMNPEAVAISFLMNGDTWDQPDPGHL
jgi:hypothetical protein